VTALRRALAVLGSNVDPERNLPAAAALLARCPGIEVARVSGVYESPPFGRPGDPWFYNAALLVLTNLPPEALRQEFRRVEAALGRRRRGDRYAPRPIDIDLAAYEGFDGEADGTRVPDPDIPRRAHLALPLAEVAPDWVHPEAGRTLGEIAAGFDPAREQVRRLPGPGLEVGPPQAADPGTIAGREAS
jgi:2-amino-4-hydroxy-6-hydroxymethyldihydropteridine diphosphokinase